MSDKIELAKCPFCGNQPIGPNHGDSDWWIDCQICEFALEHFSKSELIKKWNTRPLEEQSCQEQIEKDANKIIEIFTLNPGLARRLANEIRNQPNGGDV